MKRFLLAFLVLFFVGCGSSGGGSGIETGPEPVGTTTVTIQQQIQRQAVPVPASITQVRITGTASGIVEGILTVDGGGRPFGPVTYPIAPVYTLENVPVNVDFISLEYLDNNGAVRGLYYQKVQLVVGRTYEIIDPAITFRPDDITDFEVIGQLSSGYGAPGTVFQVPNLPGQRLLPVLPDGTPNELLQKFTVYHSENPEIIKVANGGVYFNSADTSGILHPQGIGRAKIKATFFDLEKTIGVETYDANSVGLGALIGHYGFRPSLVLEVEAGALIWNNELAEQQSKDDRFYAAFAVQTLDPNSGLGFGQPYDVSDEVEWLSSDPDILRFDNTSGRAGYFTLPGEQGKVLIYAHYPPFKTWTFVGVHEVNAEGVRLYVSPDPEE